MLPQSLIRAVLDQITDEEVWVEWLRRREVLRLEVSREYQREYQRKRRAGVPRGKRGMQLMKKHLGELK